MTSRGTERQPCHAPATSSRSGRMSRMVAVEGEQQESLPTAPRKRFTGVLPHRLLRWRRPVWWQELAIIGIGYWLYSMVRNAVPEQESIAMRHGRAVQDLQDKLH